MFAWRSLMGFIGTSCTHCFVSQEMNVSWSTTFQLVWNLDMMMQKTVICFESLYIATGSGHMHLWSRIPLLQTASWAHYILSSSCFIHTSVTLWRSTLLHAKAWFLLTGSLRSPFYPGGTQWKWALYFMVRSGGLTMKVYHKNSSQGSFPLSNLKVCFSGVSNGWAHSLNWVFWRVQKCIQTCWNRMWEVSFEAWSLNGKWLVPLDNLVFLYAEELQDLCNPRQCLQWVRMNEWFCRVHRSLMQGTENTKQQKKKVEMK